MSEAKFLEYAFKGALVIAALVLGLALVGILSLVVLPFVIGYVISRFLFKGEREAIERQKDAERLAEKQAIERKNWERAERERQARLEASQWVQELDAKEETVKEEKPSFEESDADYYKESELTHEQREIVFAWRFKRLKTSPDGKSGAAFYWVRRRYNESKEHAFFCYLIRDLLKKRRIKQITLNVTKGPDVEFEFKGKKYCFEVETGSNLVRDSVYVFRKLAFAQQNYHKCFVFVTKKKFKYRYSRMADVVTRATLAKTIAGIGRGS